MMMKEFTERTGFEPTAEEYREIEKEYMASDIHKDDFCKRWKKQGNIGRLERQRARRIEELEKQLEKTIKEAEKTEKETEKLRLEQWVATYDKLCEANKRADEAEKKLATLMAAFEAITGKEDINKVA